MIPVITVSAISKLLQRKEDLDVLEEDMEKQLAERKKQIGDVNVQIRELHDKQKNMPKQAIAAKLQRNHQLSNLCVRVQPIGS